MESRLCTHKTESGVTISHEATCVRTANKIVKIFVRMLKRNPMVKLNFLFENAASDNAPTQYNPLNALGHEKRYLNESLPGTIAYSRPGVWRDTVHVPPLSNITVVTACSLFGLYISVSETTVSNNNCDLFLLRFVL